MSVGCGSFMGCVGCEKGGGVGGGEVEWRGRGAWDGGEEGHGVFWAVSEWFMVGVEICWELDKYGEGREMWIEVER